MKRLGSIVLCCIGLAFGSFASVAGAADHYTSAGTKCAAIKKMMGQTPFKLGFGNTSGQHAMANCKAQES